MSGASCSMALGSQARGDSCAPQTPGSQQVQCGIKCEESFPLRWSLSLETAHLSLHGSTCPFRPPWNGPDTPLTRF